MRTEHVVLRIARSDGRAKEVPMRFNVSHQRGYRCYFGALADPEAEIKEATEPSYSGQNLFEVLAGWRETIEPEGWRLLHAAARADCWPKPERTTPFVEQLTEGEEATLPVDGLDPAPFAAVTTLAQQRENFDRWMASLAPVPLGRVPPRAGHEHDPAGVEFSGLAVMAGEYLVDGKANTERLLARLRANAPRAAAKSPSVR
jgi:hypothetical protein